MHTVVLNRKLEEYLRIAIKRNFQISTLKLSLYTASLLEISTHHGTQGSKSNLDFCSVFLFNFYNISIIINFNVLKYIKKLFKILIQYIFNVKK